eukprot:9469590-Pyramimonas_sp.AAC.1
MPPQRSFHGGCLSKHACPASSDRIAHHERFGGGDRPWQPRLRRLRPPWELQEETSDAASANPEDTSGWASGWASGRALGRPSGRALGSPS